MKKLVLIIFGIFCLATLRAQKLSEVQGKFVIQEEDFNSISINDHIQLKDIYIVDKEFSQLKSLGEPTNITYNNEIAYESWLYEYANMTMTFFNQNGYIQLASIVIKPEKSSKLKILGESINDNTNVDKLIDLKSVRSNSIENNKIEIGVASKINFETLNDTTLELLLEKDSKKIQSIVFRFDTI